MMSHALIVSFIVLVSYLLIARLHHWAAIVAMGAVTLILALGETLGFLSFNQIQQTIDLGVLSMMVCLGLFTDVVARSRFFDYWGVRLCRKARANPLKLLIIFNFFTYIASLWLNNLTVIYAILPLVLVIARGVGFEGQYLRLLTITLVISSNVGGASTAIGDAPNQILAITQGIPFLEFLWAMAPINLVSEIVFLLMVVFLFHRTQHTQKTADQDEKAEAALAGDFIARILEFDHRDTKIDRRFSVPFTVIGLLMLVAFVLSSFFGFSLVLVTLFGTVLTLIAVPNGHEFIRKARIKDVMIMSCLFALAGSVQATGVISHVSSLLPQLANGDPVRAMALLIVISGVMTACFSAGPTAATLVPVAASVSTLVPTQPHLAFFAMSFGILAGSSASLYAATAGPIAASQMEEVTGMPLGFFDFLSIGWKAFVIFEVIALASVSAWMILMGLGR